MSTVPFCTSGMRFCEVTGVSLTARFGQLELGLHRIHHLQHQFLAVADHLLLVVVVGKGIDDSRWPRAMVPLS